MKHVFKKGKIGNLVLANRLVHSATYEGMASSSGEVTDKLIKRYKLLAKGEVGLIIPGYLFVHPVGRAMKWQTGIHSDEMLPGLQKLTSAVHKEGGKIIFQISHAGRQTKKVLIRRTPLAPSSHGRDPVNLTKPRRMTQKDIINVISFFSDAAVRAVRAGADGIQLHACHGYLINQFLSPFFNHRRDAWGGTDEKRFRFLKTLISVVRKEMPEGMPLLVKMNAMDFTPKEGITLSLAVTYAKWLAKLNIDGLELTCGSPFYAFMNMCRGEVPVGEMVAGLPLWKKPVGIAILKSMKGKFDLEEGYNLGSAIAIKPEIGNVPLFLVGGIRRISQMEDVLKRGYADYISMSRPFIREPMLAKKLKQGKQKIATCTSCNKCLAAAANDEPVRCYYRKS